MEVRFSRSEPTTSQTAPEPKPGRLAMREAARSVAGQRWLASRQGRRELAATLLSGILLALVGPFGTFAQAELGERLVYWTGVILIAYLVYRPSCALAARLAASRGRSEASGWVIAILLANLPVTFLVWLASYRHTPSFLPSAGDLLGFYGSVFTIGAGLMLVIWLVDRAGRSSAAAARPAPQAAATPLLEKLGISSADELIALEMEDHYVRVHDPAGSRLLLMRMRDAIAAADGVEGAQVHRSWWIARRAVRSAGRHGRRRVVILANGLEVPVSRERLRDLPDWLRAYAR
jgi:hypothetical protein